MNRIHSTYGVKSIGLYWTACRDAMSVGIRYFTRPGWGLPLASVSHVGISVYYESGWAECHEALWGWGWTVTPHVLLLQWGSKPGHTLIQRDLDMTADERDLVIYESRKLVGTESYARRTIFALMVCRSLAGRMIGLLPADMPGQVICSEGAGRIIGTAARRYDLRPQQDYPWAGLTPAGMLAEYDKRFPPPSPVPGCDGGDCSSSINPSVEE